MPTIAKKRANGSKRVQMDTGTKSKVEQQHKNQCDINTIMHKMHAQGILPHFRNGGNFGDFTTLDDFHTCKNRILAANNDFMALPSQLRAKFKNDPGNLLDFLQDPENRSEAQEMGLIAPEGYKAPPEEKTPQKGSQEPTEEPKTKSEGSA